MSSQNKFNVISTFSGCGGSSLGYKLAGGKVLLAVEMDNNAVETYKLNFKDTPVYHGDIHDLSVDEVLSTCNLKEGELDIFDGSPPCQGFSTAGKRDFCDPRNQLYNEYIRLLRGLQPKVFVMENVSGMVKGKMKLIFKDILTELKASGYQVSARLMNTMYYNVPQSRKRMIFIGVRNDLNITPSHPKPQTQPISVKEALKDVKVGEVKYLEGPKALLIDKVKPGENMSKYTHNKYFNTYRVDPNKPLITISKTFGLSWGSFFAHWDSNRSLSIEELQRLGSFPDNFKFIGKFEDKWARIGNSVPPNFMKAISEHVYNNILS